MAQIWHSNRTLAVILSAWVYDLGLGTSGLVNIPAQNPQFLPALPSQTIIAAPVLSSKETVT